MKAYVRSILGIVLATFVLALLPGTIRAEVTRVEISSQEDVLGGKSIRHRWRLRNVVWQGVFRC